MKKLLIFTLMFFVLSFNAFAFDKDSFERLPEELYIELEAPLAEVIGYGKFLNRTAPPLGDHSYKKPIFYILYCVGETTFINISNLHQNKLNVNKKDFNPVNSNSLTRLNASCSEFKDKIAKKEDIRKLF